MTETFFFKERSSLPPSLLSLPSHLPLGTTVEYSNDQLTFLLEFLSFLEKFPFSGLFIDYGYERGWGDTLQSLSRHAFSSPFEKTGQQDITAHVNFGFLKNFLKQKFPIFFMLGPVSQSFFLKNLGIEIRTQMLIDLNPHVQENIQNQLYRLTAPSQMGELFKVFELHNKIGHLNP